MEGSVILDISFETNSITRLEILELEWFKYFGNSEHKVALQIRKYCGRILKMTQYDPMFYDFNSVCLSSSIIMSAMSYYLKQYSDLKIKAI